MMLLQMMCSSIFDAMQVWLIGRYFAGSYLWPFLKIGIMLACFQSLGTIPSVRDFLKILVSGSAMMSAKEMSAKEIIIPQINKTTIIPEM